LNYFRICDIDYTTTPNKMSMGFVISFQLSVFSFQF